MDKLTGVILVLDKDNEWEIRIPILPDMAKIIEDCFVVIPNGIAVMPEVVNVKWVWEK